MQDWNVKSFDMFVHRKNHNQAEEPTEEHLPRVEKWLKLADQMMSTDEEEPTDIG